MSERPPILPPALGLLMMLGVFAVHFLRPGAIVLHYPLNFVALIPIIVGAALNLMADKELRQKGVVNDNGEYNLNAGILVTSGVYRFSRNPAYLGLVLIIAGLALWVGSITPWVVVALFVLILRASYIRVEETQLTKAFGGRYEQYCKLVPRWFWFRSPIISR